MKNNKEHTLLGVLAQSEGATAVYDDSNLHIVFVNKAMLQMWGRDDRIIGQYFEDVFPEFTEQGFTHILKKVWDTGETYRATEYPADITINGITETKYFDFIYQAIIDERGETCAIVHTAMDVSVRYLALKTVQEQDTLIAFNNELEVMTNTLSHDLNNPLSIAKMGMQYLYRNDVSANEKEKWFTLVLDAIGNVENIISHTVQLNRARLYNYSNECTPMDELIRKICLESQMLYGGEVNCVFKTGSLRPVYGDKGILYQLFFNIIGNAVKYSRTIEKPTIRIDCKVADGYTVYAIEDNGIGIPERDLPHVFDQFSRASNSKGFPGTGVGLCLVKKIMTRIKGDVKVKSVLGKGTIIELYFPTNIPYRDQCDKTYTRG